MPCMATNNKPPLVTGKSMTAKKNTVLKKTEEATAPEATSQEAAAPEPVTIESSPEGDGTARSEADSLRQELEAEKARSAEYLAQWQRTAADFSNFKRRNEQERAE